MHSELLDRSRGVTTPGGGGVGVWQTMTSNGKSISHMGSLIFKSEILDAFFVFSCTSIPSDRLSNMCEHIPLENAKAQ